MRVQRAASESRAGTQWARQSRRQRLIAQLDNNRTHGPQHQRGNGFSPFAVHVLSDSCLEDDDDDNDGGAEFWPTGSLYGLSNRDARLQLEWLKYYQVAPARRLACAAQTSDSLRERERVRPRHHGRHQRLCICNATSRATSVAASDTTSCCCFCCLGCLFLMRACRACRHKAPPSPTSHCQPGGGLMVARTAHSDNSNTQTGLPPV